MGLRDRLNKKIRGAGVGKPRGGGGGGHSGTDIWRWFGKKGAPGGAYLFRLYPFAVDPDKPEDKDIHQLRGLHFKGAGQPPVACPQFVASQRDEGIDCKDCNLAAALDASSDKADQDKAWRMQAREEFLLTARLVGVLKGEEITDGREFYPASWKIVPLDARVFDTLCLLVAQAGGRISTTIPDPEDEPAKFDEFLDQMEAGIAKVCGPDGQNILVTYAPDKKGKDKFALRLLPGKPLDVPADENVPVPLDAIAEMEERIAASRK